MKNKVKGILVIFLFLYIYPTLARFSIGNNTNFNNIEKKTKTQKEIFQKDTITQIQMGTLSLSDDFIPLLFVNKNVGVDLFKFIAPFDGNIILSGFVSAGTNSQMLYSRLIKNGKIVNQKTCGIGNPLRNGYFNYQTLVKNQDRLCVQIIVIDTNWQLHCCPDLYNCTYIISRN